MRRQAIRCVLSGKARGERLLLLESLEVPDRKTKAMLAVMKALGVDSSALVVVSQPTEDVSRATRNLPRVKALTADLLNVLDLLRYDALVMTVDAAKRAEAMWDSPVQEAADTGA